MGDTSPFTVILSTYVLQGVRSANPVYVHCWAPAPNVCETEGERGAESDAPGHARQHLEVGAEVRAHAVRARGNATTEYRRFRFRRSRFK